MKKEIITILFVSILLFSPLVYAQTYSGFNRFTDNIRLFFSFGDKKVKLALEIREKEINSAIENIRNGDEITATKNLERARKKIQLVQEKVSSDVAEEVKTNVDNIIDKINEEENLPDNFETYVLEEEKTQLTAELVIEVEGKEGQTLTREIVKDSGSGENKVVITVGGDGGQTKVIEIEGKIAQLDNQIAERVVKTDMVGEEGDDGLKPVVKTDVVGGSGDDGLTPVVKTDVASGGHEEDNVVEGNGGGMAPGTSGTTKNDDIQTYNPEPLPDIIEEGNVVDGGENKIDQPPAEKENEDVTPEPNVVDDTVDPGPEGIVGSG